MPTGNIHYLQPPVRPVRSTKIDLVLIIEYDEELRAPWLLRLFVRREWSYKLTMKVFTTPGAEPTAERVLAGLTSKEVREHVQWEKTRLTLGGECHCYDQTDEVMGEFYAIATHKHLKPLPPAR